jgi:hypothetical protein|tara:strand:+ start:249 stop:500 length:252 start_codon:yes stop_codon:yes gene_type:complete
MTEYVYEFQDEHSRRLIDDIKSLFLGPDAVGPKATLLENILSDYVEMLDLKINPDELDKHNAIVLQSLMDCVAMIKEREEIND